MANRVEDARILVFIAIGLVLLGVHTTRGLIADPALLPDNEVGGFFWSGGSEKEDGRLCRNEHPDSLLPFVTSAGRLTGINPMPGDEAEMLVAAPPRVAYLFFNPVPINNAEADLLAALRGIGPALAARIVTHRERFGPLNNCDDLLPVNGIGPKKLATICPDISF